MAQQAESMVIRKHMAHMTHKQLTLKPVQGQLVAACSWVQQLQQQLQQLTCTSRRQWRSPQSGFLQKLWLCFRLAHHDQRRAGTLASDWAGVFFVAKKL